MQVNSFLGRKSFKNRCECNDGRRRGGPDITYTILQEGISCRNLKCPEIWFNIKALSKRWPSNLLKKNSMLCITRIFLNSDFL